MISVDEKARRRFWSKVDTGPHPQGCWEWTVSRFDNGYGQFWLEGTNRKAHRVSWLIATGEWPDENATRHRCDNRACVRYSHLELGTHQDNMDDMAARGRRVTLAFRDWSEGVCQRNHDVTDVSNVYVTREGWKKCRQCQLDNRNRRYREKVSKCG